MFVDEVRVTVKSGAGGRGCVSFRREKHVPRGGPDGGHGGRGGDVVLVADPHIKTLVDFRFRPLHRAERGEHGRGKNQTGASGKETILRVPLGTDARDVKTGARLADLIRPGERVVIARGGRGGRGNASFATSTNRAPRRAEPGEAGAELELHLELRLLADVGIVGFPNAGKSTLISVISSARPKIADYPFTTLTPHLGVVRLGEGESFVAADVPGLIPGANRGAGLGTRFLRHLARTSLLVHLLDLSPLTKRDPVEDYHLICRELEGHGQGLGEKPRILAVNKIDLPGAAENLARVRSFAAREGLELYPISALARRGLKKLIGAMKRELDRSSQDPVAQAPNCWRAS